MRKYHLNPKTGNVNVCRAQKSCPLGGDDLHFADPKEARTAYEKAMQTQIITSASNNKGSQDLALNSIMDTELLYRMIYEGYIMVQTHPDNPNLRVMTYSKTAQVAGKWNDATKQARGLIIRAEKDDLSDAVVLERPWRKFFSLEQIRTEDGRPGWALGDEEEGAASSANNEFDKLDFHAPAEVTDKMDGSLGILYKAPDGKLAMATKGSFASDQAVAYTKMLRVNEKMYAAAEKLKEDHPDTTYLFELVGKDNQIVLEYDKDDITFLGAVNKDTGVYYSTSDFSDTWGDEQGLSRAEVMHAKNLEEALAMPDRLNKEGVVVRFKTDDPEKQMQVKIKQSDYVTLHRLVHSFSSKASREVLRDSKINFGQVFSMANSGNVEEIEGVKNILSKLKNGNGTLYDSLYERHKENFAKNLVPAFQEARSSFDYVQSLPEANFIGDPREKIKEFALSLKEVPREKHALLFTFFKARLQGEDITQSSADSILSKVARNFE